MTDPRLTSATTIIPEVARFYFARRTPVSKSRRLALLSQTFGLALAFLLVATAPWAWAQPPNFAWAAGAGGPALDLGNAITVDGAGNNYTTGLFRGTVDFDPGPGTSNLTSLGSTDLFIRKLDAAGNFVWVADIGGSAGTAAGTDIAVDEQGNVYCIGTFFGTVDFDPGPGTLDLTSAGAQDISVQKLDADGNLLWAVRIGGRASDIAGGIAVDAAGSVYTTGRFGATVDFDPGAGSFNLTGVSDPDTFVQKLDADGNFLWAIQSGGSATDSGEDLAVDDSGNVYTVGHFGGSIDLDPGAGTFLLTSSAVFDLFVQKLDPDGNFLWAIQTGGSETVQEVSSVALDPAGGVYVMGPFEGTVDFDPGPDTLELTSAGSDDIFVQKLDESGDLLWATAVGGRAADLARGIAVDGAGNVYTAGFFQGVVDFDPGPDTFNMTSVGPSDLFIQKLDPSGNFVWAADFGGPVGAAFGFDIAVDRSGSVYSTGVFLGTVDFDPGPDTFNLSSAAFSVDIFVLKLGDITEADADGDGVTDDLDVCPGTSIPEATVPSARLGVNRWALVDGDTLFDTAPPPGGGGGPGLGFTVDDTGGCSCEQIIDALGLGQGHVKFGCSNDAIETWVDLANP